MKRELFELYDNDIFELKSKVTGISQEGDFLLVALDKTPFRASSGGQPADKGTLENNNFKGFVEELIEDRDEVLHKVRVEKGALKQGDSVTAKIDAERRRKLKQMHSGEHLFFGALKRIMAEHNESIDVEKIRLEQEESVFFVKTKNLNWDMLFKAEALANKIIKEGREVKVCYAKPEEIDAFIEKGLRIKKDRIKDEFVRVLDFKDLDVSACTGTHVKNTKEIVAFIVTDFKNLGNEKFEIRFKTGENAEKEVSDFSREFRRIKAISAKEKHEVFDFVRKQIFDKEALKEKYYAYLSEFVLSLKPENINGISFYSHSFENDEQKVLVKCASKLCIEKAIVCFLNKRDDKKEKNGKAESKEEGIELLLLTSKDLHVNLLKFFNEEILKLCSGKGGGNAYFVNAILYCKEQELELLMQKIRVLVENMENAQS